MRMLRLRACSPSVCLLAFFLIPSLARTQATAPNDWTWLGGDSAMTLGPDGIWYGPGVYGTLGTPAAGNIPGGRIGSASWTDQSGHFWLFGGWGFDAVGNAGELNDLWEFNPITKEWAWISGGSADYSPGVYGTPRSFALGGWRVFQHQCKLSL
ncbi:MAG: kelch repeat-containing protein [Terracidiphilus sp.]